MTDAPAAKNEFDTGLRIYTLMDEFNRHWEGMKVDIAMLWLKCAQADIAGKPLTITELSEATKMSLASASRNVQLLETRRADKNDAHPLDLLETRVHPNDYRTRLVVLTPKGRNFYKRLLALMG